MIDPKIVIYRLSAKRYSYSCKRNYVSGTVTYFSEQEQYFTPESLYRKIRGEKYFI